MENLKRDSNIAIAWFQNNYVKMDSFKCHLLVPGLKFEQIWTKIGTDIIWKNNSLQILGITRDNHSQFGKHIPMLCAKAEKKIVCSY